MADCPHDVIFAGMCVVCGSTVNPEGRVRPGFLTTREIQVSGRVLEGLESDSKDRLALILDLDHTLMTCNADTRELRHRPGLHDFLRQTKEFYELYLYTQATGPYAEKAIQSLEDPSIFGEPPRIFHRENTPPGFKDLHQIFPSAAQKRGVLVVDDREDVWPQRVRGHLIKVLPFLPFPQDLRQGVDLEHLITGLSQTDLTPLSVKRRRLDDSKAYCRVPSGEASDQQLQYLGAILKRILKAFRDVDGSITTVVESLRQDTLKGCCICLTGMCQEAKRRLSRCCNMLGATCAELEGSSTSHVVAAGRTEKLWRAKVLQEAGNPLKIVHPGWLLAAYVTWQRPKEENFPLPEKNGDGKPPSFLDLWSQEYFQPAADSDARTAGCD